MENNFVLSCESTVDLPFSYISGRNIEVLFYTYSVDGVEYDDDMGRDPEALARFYSFMSAGKFPATSQINIYKYTEYFESLLRLYSGDILHIAMGSGMSPSVSNAVEAAAVLEKNKNVAADLSGLIAGRFEPDAYYRRNARYVEQLRTWIDYLESYDALMYGTDWPLVDMGEYLEFAMRLIPEEFHEKVFYENAKRIYRLPV